MKAKKYIRHNAKSYNKHLTDEYFDSLTEVQKLGLAHPVERVDLARMLIAEKSVELKNAKSEVEIMGLKHQILRLQDLILTQKTKDR